MKFKQIIFILVFILLFSPQNNISAQEVKSNTMTENESSSVQNLVDNHTPKFVSKIFDKVIHTTENFRIATADFLENKRIKARQELGKEDPVIIRDLTEEVNYTDSFNDVIKETKHGIFIKPFKYAELFFLSITSAYFKNKTAFYIISIILIFLVFRGLTKQ